jgi:hypothetical protein
MSVSLNIAMVDLGEERAASSDQRRATIVALILIVCCGLIAPVIRLPLGVSYPIFAIVIALSIAAISVTSVLLWAQARVTRSAPLSVLALGYALTSLVMLPYMLFFHGMWPELIDFVSADTETSAWLYVEWHMMFLCSMLAYFAMRRYHADRPALDARAFRSFRRRLYGIGAAIFGCTVPPLIWIDGLPRLGYKGHATGLFTVVAAIVIATAIGAIAYAYRTNRFRAVHDLWLARVSLDVGRHHADAALAAVRRGLVCLTVEHLARCEFRALGAALSNRQHLRPARGHGRAPTQRVVDRRVDRPCESPPFRLAHRGRDARCGALDPARRAADARHR